MIHGNIFVICTSMYVYSIRGLCQSKLYGAYRAISYWRMMYTAVSLTVATSTPFVSSGGETEVQP
jgi:hypothetical protein